MRRFFVAAYFCAAIAASGETQLRFFLRSEPRTLNPLLAEDDASNLVRYLTGGVLMRVNRVTQQLEPELATSWKMSRDGKQLTLQLRKSVRFSDGSPFDSADVLHTFKMLMDPNLHSAVADSLRPGDKAPQVRSNGTHEVVLTFAVPTGSAPRLLDQLTILSSRNTTLNAAVLGPFRIAESRQGSYLLLKKNPNYWKGESGGKSLPRIDSIRLGIQGNRELEALSFRRHEIDLITNIDARTYEDLAKALPGQVVDAGPALDSDFLFFNQVKSAKIPENRKAWFRSLAFRKAISMAIDRQDICRIVWRGHAIPAAGPYPPSNKVFFNDKLRPYARDIAGAKKLLSSAGFSEKDGVLRDSGGNPVAFTLLTNAGNRSREQTTALIQRDLKAIGIAMNIVTLDFPALLDRISRTYEYEACLLGLTNIDPDPNGMMNVWLSSGANHQWNPSQAKPETPWEAEIDRLMKAQAVASSEAERRTAFHKVQEVLYEQQPFIYLVHPNALSAVSSEVHGVKPAILTPRILWNIDALDVVRQSGGSR